MTSSLDMFSKLKLHSAFLMGTLHFDRAPMALLFFALATVIPTTSALATEPAGIGTAPPIPVATVPFKLTFDGRYFGSPVTVDAQELQVSDETILWILFVTLGSPNTAPALLKAESTNHTLSPGPRAVSVYVRHRINGSMYSDPNLVGEGSIQVHPSAALNILVEYFNAARNHYFQTIDPVEMAALDSGYFVGWARTGQVYLVYSGAYESSAGPALDPVCRYYGKPSAGLDTHFFSAFSFECDAIPALFPDQWIAESMAAYWVYLPRVSDGACPAGTTPVYRLFNGKRDVNHRYVTTQTLQDEMTADGWIAEGFGQAGVGMCAIASK